MTAGPVRKIREAEVPPSDLDAEGVVLSAVLVGGAAELARVREVLEPKHFYADANRRVYEAALELDAEGRAVDSVAVAGLLRGRGQLQGIGGSAYLAQLTDATPATANVVDHARTVRELARQRAAIELGRRMVAEAHGDTGDTGAWLAAIARDVEALLEPGDHETVAPQAPPATPDSIVAAWQVEGALVRVPTGIPALDKLCRGGIPIPWRVIVIGPPSAGKTMVSMSVANNMARAASESGAVVGVIAVDEEPEDVTVRLLQIAGYSVSEVEQREPHVLEQMRAAIAGLSIRFYDATWTIEAAAADLAAWSREHARHGVLFIDSLQTARSADGIGKMPRESVEANVRAMRVAATTHRLLVVATSEANRASYRNEAAAQESNDMAAGAETRAIEFGAQTLLMLRTPKDEADIINVKVVKNRRAHVGEFWLRLDRERHRVTECDDPNADPDRVATRQQEQRASVKASVLFDAEHLAGVLRAHPDGLGELALRTELRSQGFKWGRDRLATAKRALAAGHKGCRLVEVDEGPGKAKVSRLTFATVEEGSSV